MVTNLTKTNHIPTVSMRNVFLLFFWACLLLTELYSQENSLPNRWGIQIGYGTQQTSPFHSLDYDYQQAYLLGHILLKRVKVKKLHLDLIAEGGYYLSTHQLINKWFTTTDLFKDFAEDFQQQMLRKKDIHQLVAHLGLEAFHFIHHKIQLYIYAALGPMWVSQQTERLASGLAFSDNVGAGIKVKLTKKTWLNTAVILRHESNANLKFPNSGHNTLGVRLGFVFNLTPPQKGAAQ